MIYDAQLLAARSSFFVLFRSLLVAAAGELVVATKGNAPGGGQTGRRNGAAGSCRWGTHHCVAVHACNAAHHHIIASPTTSYHHD